MQLKSTHFATRAAVHAGLLATLLAGCSDTVERDDPADDRSAAGEVRGGTISDEMLPLDQLQSQSPPLREAPEEARAVGSDTGEVPEESAAEVVEDPQPQAEPPAEVDDEEV